MKKGKREEDVIVLTEMISKGKTKEGFIKPLPAGTIMKISRTLSEVLFLMTNFESEYTVNESRCRPATEAEKFLWEQNFQKNGSYILTPEKQKTNESER